MSVSAPVAPIKLQTFHAACWVLGLIGFLELVAVGVALALQDRQVAGPRVVERVEYVALPPRVDLPPSAGEPVGWAPSPAAVVAPPAEFDPETPSAMPVIPSSPVPLKTPPIADPIVERLVAEAREARVADDSRRAIVKLEEAEKRAPNEPNVLYQYGQVLEAMGVYGKAADYYQKVFELGAVGAGSLYQLASHKIAHGFAGADEMSGKLALGRIRQFEDPRVGDGQKLIITVPVLAAPNQELEPKQVLVVVSFFDKLREEIVPAAPRNKPSYRWVTEPVDWMDPSGEELLQVTYFIPNEEVQDLHLFGQRKHFGQLVELSYEAELVDSQAWPRILARRVNVPERDPLFLPEEFIPNDLNPDNPLLPALPRR